MQSARSLTLPALMVAAAMSAAPLPSLAANDKSDAKAAESGAIAIVVKATNACFSDMVRVTGFLVPRREAIVGVEQEGFRVAEVLVRPLTGRHNEVA